MKILYITNGITGSGGLERVLSIKTNCFVEKYHHEICIFSLNEENKEPFYNFNSKIKFYSFSLSKNSIYNFYLYLKNLIQVVKFTKPDLIIVCDDGLKGFFLPLLFKRTYHMIYERHVSIQVFGNTKGSRLKLYLMRKLALLYDRFIVLTNENKNEWKGLTNICVIPNMSPFYSLKTSTLRSQKAIAVGKIAYQKGYEYMIEIWSYVHKEFPSWQLHIYGAKSSTYFNILEKIKYYNLENVVFLHDPEKHIEEKYLDSSIYLMTSRYEGLPMVLIEAMTCGLPCISFNCPCGPKDIIIDNVNGFLIPNNDIKLFAEKVLLLIRDEQKRLNMGQNARETSQNYSQNYLSSIWNDIFIDVVSD